MSLENEDQILLDQPSETNHEWQKKLKILYKREFLLSLSELDVCRKLPSGLDQSILSEFEDSFQDQQRVSSALSSHSYRRNEYGSSPPTKGDFNSYSWGVHGRWESRSSVRGDKDSDSQSDWELDSGRRYGNQSRRSWQVPEHDGLLGSGSFPRPSGFAAGVSAPTFRANVHSQLNKSNEPYHPPRPYKAVPHLRRETNDSYNDETFGFSESTSEDRAEEERKRRVSFELMRREHQKAFQEEQKLNPDKRKYGFDITTLLEDSKDEKSLLNRSSVSDDPVTPKASHNDSEKSSFPPQTPASRPLVPPGFTSTVLERNFGSKSVIQPHTVEVVNPELENCHSHAKGNLILNGVSDHKVEEQSSEQKVLGTHKLGSTSNNVSLYNNSDKNLDVPSSNKIDVDTQLHKTSYLSEAFEASENSEVIELNGEKVTRDKIVGESNHDRSTSILDKLFGSALTPSGGGSSSSIEHNTSKADETIPHASQSSKFARWFPEEEKKLVADLSSSRPNDFLSLIVSGEKGGSREEVSSDVKNTEHVLSNFPFERFEPADKKSNLTSDIIENSEQLYKNNKLQALPAVLTCEDLEQSILSEISENGSTQQLPAQALSIPYPKTELPSVNINDHASQHLLSLLQKGTGLKDTVPSSNLDIRSSEKLQNNEGVSFDSAARTKEVNSENSSSSGQSLTLETLFGTAFMMELQSVGAPVSVQRGSAGSAIVDVPESHEFPFPEIDDALVLPNEIGSNSTSYESSVLTSKERLQTKPVKIDEQWFCFDDPQAEPDSFQVRTGLKSKLGGFDRPVDTRLSEEDSLITVNDPLNLQSYAIEKTAARTNALTSPNTQVDIAEKLAAWNAILKDKRAFMGGQEGPPFLCGARDRREPNITYQNLSVQPSSPQLQPPHSNHVGPLLHPLDSCPANIHTQLKFMTPDRIIHHDPPPNHQFPANMLRPQFRHPSPGLTGFDLPSHHPMLQQMYLSGNFPPPHLLRGFPGSAPMSTQPNRGAPMPHASNQMTGSMPELNPLQAFPFGHRQPNFAGLGLPPPAPEIGGVSTHPEAIQRLIERELRSKSKQVQPFAAADRGQGMYGHEVDMGFGYR
ncbi:uncharacterized protein LOC122299158 isoform X1 [Carya illinoinensis]|uniref:uncharacterized protein LOC122299158 isoform X1 n=1 Tax=Carya illinoinensis TaxID=32201 RepID=UPI001C71FD4C|nr:uncharacterized protein LOC122299158 isoform X1 [Carya illinoinensis]